MRFLFRSTKSSLAAQLARLVLAVLVQAQTVSAFAESSQDHTTTNLQCNTATGGDRLGWVVPVVGALAHHLAHLQKILHLTTFNISIIFEMWKR